MNGSLEDRWNGMTIYIQNGKHKSSKTASDKAPTVREILED
jgi:hypothetical protein